MSKGIKADIFCGVFSLAPLFGLVYSSDRKKENSYRIYPDDFIVIYRKMVEKTINVPRKRIGGRIFFFVLVSIISFSPDILPNQEIPKKTVLVLHSYYQGYKWTDDEHKGIESVLIPVIGRNNLFVEYMDTRKIFSNLYSQRLFEVYKLKYKNFKFDLIIATDNNAFEFMLKYRDTLFPGTPVVFCGVNYFQENDLKGHKNFTGVNEENDFKLCIELILKLHPKTKQIIFINEWSTTGQAVHGALMKILPHFNKTIKFILLEDVNLEEIIDQLKSISSESVVLYTSFSRDKSGKIFEYNESLSIISQNSKIPIYTPYEFNLNFGVVGGLMVSGYDQGEAAARIAFRILQGERIEDISVVMVTPKRYIFDYVQMQKFHIDQSDLPKESIIINLPQTLYFKYKEWIHFLIVVFIALFAIISVLSFNLYKRNQYEKKLKSSRSRLRALAWRLAETEETRRKLLSRELHDQIGQNLTLLGVNLNLLRSLIQTDDGNMIHSRINDSVMLVKQTTERIRNLMNDLRSPVLDDYGLIAAIKLYGKQFSDRTGLDIIIRNNAADRCLPAPVENALFRIAQESLTNVVKHAQAKQVIVSLNVSNGKVCFSVEDDGIGYDMMRPESEGEKHRWGLVTMNERALAVGGVCRIQSMPGLGTHVIVEVPL